MELLAGGGACVNDFFAFDADSYPMGLAGISDRAIFRCL